MNFPRTRTSSFCKSFTVNVINLQIKMGSIPVRATIAFQRLRHEPALQLYLCNFFNLKSRKTADSEPIRVLLLTDITAHAPGVHLQARASCRASFPFQPA